MKKWVCRLSIVCCLCLFFTSVKAQLSLGGFGDILNSSTVNKVVSAIVGTDASLTVADLAGTWKYSAPACKFESSDFLKSAGGEVVAASLQSWRPTIQRPVSRLRGFHLLLPILLL